MNEVNKLTCFMGFEGKEKVFPANMAGDEANKRLVVVIMDKVVLEMGFAAQDMFFFFEGLQVVCMR